MKRCTLFFTILLTSLSLIATQAEAKRLGGGSSIGKQRSLSKEQMQKAPPAAAPAQNAAPQNTGTPAKPGNKWLGPLAGIAAGLGLAALFSHLGLSEGLGMLLMLLLVVVAVFFLLGMLRKKTAQPAMHYAGAGAPYDGIPPAAETSGGGVTPATQAAGHIPADFPVEAFLRNAKISFIRLQAANDRKDLDDIREYTTPEMFAEISMQLQERGTAPQKTEVLSVQATLLEVVNEGELAIASVRMTGQLRENDGPVENFDEVWHVQKNLKDERSVWLLAGIQQI